MNRVNKLFKIKYPIIQGGMVWCSGWELVSAVSNCGGLGLIGSGSMRPDILEDHILKCKKQTLNPFGVNIPLLYPYADEHIKIVIKNKIKIVFTSAGNPKMYTDILKDNNITVVHVVSSLKFALKALQAGVDAIVAEGFEAGGHNGINETTTMCLIPIIKKEINIPIIAAGGIGCGAAMMAAFSLGAEGVQMGSRFITSHESSAHLNFKSKIIESVEGDTDLTLKEITAVRMLKNNFYQQIRDAYNKGASVDDLRRLLGKGRAKKGMFEGDLNKGELEVGQVSASIKNIYSVEQIFNNVLNEFFDAQNRISKITL